MNKLLLIYLFFIKFCSHQSKNVKKKNIKKLKTKHRFCVCYFSWLAGTGTAATANLK